MNVKNLIVTSLDKNESLQEKEMVRKVLEHKYKRTITFQEKGNPIDGSVDFLIDEIKLLIELKSLHHPQYTKDSSDWYNRISKLDKALKLDTGGFYIQLSPQYKVTSKAAQAFIHELHTNPPPLKINAQFTLKNGETWAYRLIRQGGGRRGGVISNFGNQDPLQPLDTIGIITDSLLKNLSKANQQMGRIGKEFGAYKKVALISSSYIFFDKQWQADDAIGRLNNIYDNVDEVWLFIDKDSISTIDQHRLWEYPL